MMSKETIQQMIDRHVIDNSGQWNHGTDEGWILAGQVQFKITREEFNAAADRLRGKPDWEDVLAKHPKAQYLAQWPGIDDAEKGLWISYDRVPDDREHGYCVDYVNEVFHHNKGNIIGDWRNTLEKRPEQKGTVNIPAFSLSADNIKQSASNPWFKVGELPPVGEAVMVNIHQQGTHEATVIGAFQRWVWLDVKSKGIDTFDVSYIRPIKTDKEKAIEAAVTAAFDGLKHASGLIDDVSMNIIVSSIYDAGLLRLPDNKKPD